MLFCLVLVCCISFAQQLCPGCYDYRYSYFVIHFIPDTNENDMSDTSCDVTLDRWLASGKMLLVRLPSVVEESKHEEIVLHMSHAYKPARHVDPGRRSNLSKRSSTTRPARRGETREERELVRTKPCCRRACTVLYPIEGRR